MARSTLKPASLNMVDGVDSCIFVHIMGEIVRTW